MQAEIISIGDELLIGQTVNTNSSWLGEKMNNIGIRIHRSTSIADDRMEILAALQEASARSQLILITGGLGPTKDDITKHTLCEYFDTDLVMNKEALLRITNFFVACGVAMLEINERQAELPRNCTVIQNMMGTACAMWFERDSVIYVAMPGVPYEMIAMMEQEIIPKIVQHFERPKIFHRTILTMGIGESFLSKKIQNWESSLELENVKLAYLPSPGAVKLRMSYYQNQSHEIISNFFEQKEKELNGLIEEYIYGYDKETIESNIGKLLIAAKQSLSVAESCTGGFLSHLITSVAGSSQYFKGGIISYHNDVKTAQLNVSPSLVETHGVVSEEVAEAMAKGVKMKLSTDWALASTGVAGPDGGTETSPVGTVWIAVAGPNRVIAKCFNLGAHRERTIMIASNYALNLLRKEILSQVVGSV